MWDNCTSDQRNASNFCSDPKIAQILRCMLSPRVSIKLHALANTRKQSRVLKGGGGKETEWNRFAGSQSRFNKISLSYGLASFKEHRSDELARNGPPGPETTANIYPDDRVRNSKYDCSSRPDIRTRNDPWNERFSVIIPGNVIDSFVLRTSWRARDQH